MTPRDVSSLENRHAARAALVKPDIIPFSRMIRPRYFSLVGETHALPSTKRGYLLYLRNDRRRMLFQYNFIQNC